MKMESHDLEKRWKRFRRRQKIETIAEKVVSISKKHNDVDPRNVVRALLCSKDIVLAVRRFRKLLNYERSFRSFVTKGKGDIGLVKPIFVIGVPHSGTTISMKLLSMHKDVSNSSELNTYFHPRDYLDLKGCDHVKTEGDVTLEDATRLRNRLRFEQYIKGNRERFLNKNPINTVTFLFLKKCFPDCYIVHIIRDGRAVVNSIMHGLPDEVETYDRYKKPSERINPFPGVKPPNWRELLEADPLLQHAKQWNACINYVIENRKKVEGWYTEILYEALCENPRREIRRVWDFVALKTDEEGLKRIPETLESKNYKYLQRLSSGDISRIMKVMYRNLRRFEYV